ncbi:MAG TPA: tetratricopeptide repeat protein [Pseudomonadales bacterium]|nr:tetratricopeptide repeat protein [Pseudomonadales bacterium]
MTTFLALALALMVAAPAAALAESAPTPSSRGPVQTPAEEEYGKGVRAKRAKEWSVAVASFKKATELKPDFPEAWNELGYAFRNVGNYPDSVKAYDEALRLKPRFPEALEYLGEAYVKMGQVEEARKVLERLKPLDRKRAQELADEIAKAK